MIAGIDLGGTQVRVAVARSDGQILATARTRTPMLQTPERVVEWVAAQAARHLGRQKMRSVAIGAPGPIDTRKGLLVNPPNLPGWRNVPLSRLLSDAFGCPAFLENDANLAGLGEHHRGAGRGTANMVYVTWSTGVGGGVTRSWQVVEPVLTATLRASPFIKPARRPRRRRARLGDRGGLVGAVEWARQKL